MDFLEKLDFLMERYGLNKRTLSQKSEIPYTTIDNWYKRGYENLTLPTLRKLASYFNTTLDYWFLDEITDPNYGKSSGFKVDYTEMEHVKKYRSLDPHGQQTVNIVLDRELERTGQLLEAQNRITELESQASKLTELQSKIQKDKSYLRPVAAHERTDIEVTDEMRKADDDLMNNDDFWK